MIVFFYIIIIASVIISGLLGGLLGGLTCGLIELLFKNRTSFDDWKDIANDKPRPDREILVYNRYSEKVTVISSPIPPYLTNISHWKYLSAPHKNNKK